MRRGKLKNLPHPKVNYLSMYFKIEMEYKWTSKFIKTRITVEP